MLGFINSSSFDFNFSYIINFKTQIYTAIWQSDTKTSPEIPYFGNKAFKNYLKPWIFKAFKILYLMSYNTTLEL